jgi:hydroxylaminobenzene mutase
MEDTPRRLMWHGMFLFLLGLLTGFLEPHFINMRMGLAAHLEGVMNGIFLVTLGCAWSRVRLALAALAVAFWTVLYSAYVNWLSTTLAALWGTAALSPLTGMSHPAKPWQEIVVTVGLLSVGLALLAGTILILWGLRRGKSAA